MFFSGKSATESDVRKALEAVMHPVRQQSFAELDMIEGVVVKDGEVTFVLKLGPDDQTLVPQLRALAEGVVAGVKGAKVARAIFTASSKAEHKHEAPRKAPSVFRAGPELGKIIAVMSGKGGVGKSTVAANLAVVLAQKGLRVGLLDADIYGPSVPRLFGITEKPRTENNKLVPIEKFGLRIMSIGFIVEEHTPVIWRGPVVQKAIRQLVEDVAWGELDVLVIDMPPGTGDVQLTFVQSTPLAGGVVVSTPQDLALVDARRAIAMFHQLKVPILGLIENMSGFVCSHCGARTDVFGAGGAREEAQRIGEEFLGEIPLDITLRQTSDAGAPITASDPQGALAKNFHHFADAIWKKLGLHAAPSRSATS